MRSFIVHADRADEEAIDFAIELYRKSSLRHAGFIAVPPGGSDLRAAILGMICRGYIKRNLEGEWRPL